MWEIRVIDKDNNSYVFGIHCKYSSIKYEIEIFKWEIYDQYFDIDVYFYDYYPEISYFEKYNEILIIYGIKEIKVAIKWPIFRLEELEYFKNYCKLIISTNKEIDESNLC